MKAFIKKNKKALIIGGVILVVGIAWYFYNKKKINKIGDPTIPTIKSESKSTADPLTQAKAIVSQFNADKTNIVVPGSPPTLAQRNAMTARDKQLETLGYKLINNQLVPVGYKLVNNQLVKI